MGELVFALPWTLEFKKGSLYRSKTRFPPPKIIISCLPWNPKNVILINPFCFYFCPICIYFTFLPSISSLCFIFLLFHSHFPLFLFHPFIPSNDISQYPLSRGRGYFPTYNTMVEKKLLLKKEREGENSRDATRHPMIIFQHYLF